MENTILRIFKIVFGLITLISVFFSVLVIITIISDLINKFKNKKPFESPFRDFNCKPQLLWFFFIFGVINFYMLCFSSYKTQIGSIYESDYYEETYYVYFYYDNETTKCYKIPAKIYANDENNYYTIAYVTWPNGNIMYFSDYAYVLPNVKSEVEYINSDGDYKKCFIELTTEKYKQGGKNNK